MSSKPNILYVDDEPINLQLFELNFKNKYCIHKGTSGYEGYEILKNNPNISIVISDMRMPGMSGIEFIAKAKKEFPNVIFFILTGFDITEEIHEALSTKLIDQYFRKPLMVSEIDKAISNALSKQ